MNVAAIAESVSAVTLVIGVGFAVVQVRQTSRRRRHEAVIELVQSFRTPQFTEALDHLSQFPPGISDADMRQRMGDRMPLVTGLAGTWEAFGILVFRGDIDIALFEDFFSCPILCSWAVLRDFVMQYRKDTQRETLFEWFQWLAERVAEREEYASPVPAHIEHRDWRPARSR